MAILRCWNGFLKLRSSSAYHHTPDADRVEIVVIHFEKDVIPWFQMLQRMESVSSWSDLTRALESQFGPSPFDCPMGELFKLQQTGSVSYYYLKFMSLANRSEGLSNEVVLNCFVSGLDPDIRRDVVAQSPTTLIRVVSLAKLYEEKYAPKVSSRPNNYVHKYTPLSATNTHSNYVFANVVKHTTKSSLPPLLPTPNTPPLKNGAVKKISLAEMQLRREKVLCYFCDDKFTFNHRFPNRQILMLQLDDEEVESETIFDAHTGDTNSNPKSGIESPPHLSLNALKGGPGVGTIRFVARINTLPVKVLVDGGSSDNFLQPRVANFLKLPIEPAPSFKVMVGNEPTSNWLIKVVDETKMDNTLTKLLNQHAQGARLDPKYDINDGLVFRKGEAYDSRRVHSKDLVSLQETLISRDKLLQQLRDNLLRAQNYMKLQADKKRREVQLDVGDLALVKLQPYRQHSVALRKNQKLGMRFFWSF
ncbi:Retrotransposon gag domain [Sesbania bispinosa]|nr:Retrotransposon gag domain [Sesbania bispinosa]